MDKMTKAEKKTAEILIISHFFAPLGGPIFLLFLYYFAVKKSGTRLLFLSAVSNVLSASIALIYTIITAFSLYSMDNGMGPYLILIIPAMLIIGCGFQMFLLRVNLRMRRLNINRQLRANPKAV